jgi:hypothetical protein
MDDVDPTTFLTEVYAIVSTAWPAAASRRPGPVPRMSDVAIVTLVLLGRFTGKSQRAILRWAAGQPETFPVLLSQSAFNRRVHRLADGLGQLLQVLAAALGVADDAYEIVDGLPVPLAQRCRGERHRLFTPAQAGIGRGGPGRSWYFGESVLVCVAASGPITGLAIAPANVGERWQLSALLTWRHDSTAVPQAEAALAARGARTARYLGPSGALYSPGLAGQTVAAYYLADQGFAGAPWQAYWREELGATVVTAEPLSPGLRHWFHHARQTIETVNAHLTGALHVRFPPARTLPGVVLHILAACVAFNLGMLLNRHLHRPDFAIPSLCNL